jgi:hypothetical protein
MCKLLKDTWYWWDEACEKSTQSMKTTLIMLLLLIILDWTRKFHDTNASNYVIRTMLVQNLDNTIDEPIYYASQLMIEVEKNYSTIEKETFAMIFSIKKLCHYLLGNNFTFFVDHQALINLVNKKFITG